MKKKNTEKNRAYSKLGFQKIDAPVKVKSGVSASTITGKGDLRVGKK